MTSTHSRTLRFTLTFVAIVTLVAALLLSRQTTLSPQAAEAPGSVGDKAAHLEERAELMSSMRGRVQAGQAAARSGESDLSPITHGFGFDNNFDGETLYGDGNDWEPDIAADPNGPYVYVLTTRFGGAPASSDICDGCGYLVYRVSDDNGDTWGPSKMLCTCPGINWQADPQVEVADDGTVFATILQKWRSVLIKSTDHGQTWSDPVDVAPDFPWTDHEFLTISPDGQDVYVAFNKGASFVSASHDGGATFAPPVRTNPFGQNLYYYHYKGDVLSDDTVLIAATSLRSDPYATGPVHYYVLRSTDGGATWQQIDIATVKEQPDCPSFGCRKDHLAGQSNLVADTNDDLVYTYAGSKKPRKGQVIYITRSSDGGLTWSPPDQLSPNASGSRKAIASFPAIDSGGAGDFRLWWMDDRRGPFRWNVYYTTSGDGGLTWEDEVRISDATGGTGYKHPIGFNADYGDYGGITITDDGRTITATGQGFSYWGPGGTWINRQMAP